MQAQKRETNTLEEAFQIHTSRSEWQKKPVRTLVVNARSRNPAERSIGSAIAHAQPYDRIEVIGGEYYECVSLQFPIEIVASEGERPVLTFRGPALQCAADIPAYIDGIQFISKAKSRHEFAVVCAAGQPEFYNCTISSMHVTGTCSPKVRFCEITGSAGGIGLRVSESCNGVFAENRIYAHQEVCVAVDCTGAPIFRDNVIYQQTETIAIACEGLMTTDVSDIPPAGAAAVGHAVFENNTIYCEQQPAAVQLVAASGERPAGRGMTSTRGEVCCVYVAFGASPVFRQNELSQGEIGFLFEAGGVPVLEANIVRGQRVAGMRIHLGMSEDLNAVASNVTRAERHAFSYADEGRSICIEGSNCIDRCKVGIDVVGFGRCAKTMAFQEAFHERKDAFLRSVIAAGTPEAAEAIERRKQHSQAPGASRLPELSEAARGSAARAADLVAKSRKTSGVSIAQARIVHCADSGVRYRNGAFGLVVDCDVEHAGAHGIVIEQGSFPIVAGCRIRENGESGVSVTTGADPLLVANAVRDQRQLGMRFTEHGRGTAVDNVIFGTTGSSIDVSRASSPQLVRNIITSNGGGIAVSHGARPVIAHNGLTHNAGFEIRVSDSAQPLIRSNNIVASDGNGILFTQCAGGIAANNVISECRAHGVVIELDADPVVERNSIRKNGEHGLLVRNNGLGTVIDNTFEVNDGYNIKVETGGDPTVRANKVIEGVHGGIGINEEGCGVVEKNLFRGNSNAQVHVDGRHTSPKVLANTCAGGPAVGILCSNGSTPIVRRNACQNHVHAGILSERDAAPQVIGNTVVSERVGVLAENGGAGVFRSNRFGRCSVAGVMIQTGATPKFVDNDVSANLFCGLCLGHLCSGMVLRNQITDNAVGITSRGARNTTATLARRADVAKSTNVEENTVSRNSVAGVLLETDASGLFINNSIHDNGKWGVLGHADFPALAQQLNAELERDAQGNLTAGAIADEILVGKSAAISAKVGDGTAVLRRNAIYNHAVANVGFVHHPVQNEFVIEENTITAGAIGIAVEGTSSVNMVKGNSVDGCGTGVLCSGSGRATFEANSVVNSIFANVHIAQDAAPVFRAGNRFSQSRCFGVFVEGRCRGEVTGCHIEDNHECGVGLVHAVMGHRPRTTFSDNSIRSNGVFGIVVVPPVSAPETLRYVTFASRTQERSGFDDGSAPRARSRTHAAVFSRNVVELNAFAGVYVAPLFSSTGLASSGRRQDPTSLSRVSALHPNTTPASPHRAGRAGSSSRPDDEHAVAPVHFESNTISRNRVGVIVDANVEPVVVGNTIEANVSFGLVARPFAAPTVEKNTISNNWAVGMLCAQLSKGVYRSNTLAANNAPAVRGEREAAMKAPPAFAEEGAGGSYNVSDGLATQFRAAVRSCALVAKFYGSRSSLRLVVRRDSSPSAESSALELLSPASQLSPASSMAADAVASADEVLIVEGVGIWLEQGGEVLVEHNECSAHSTCGILYATVALLDADYAAADGATPASGSAVGQSSSQSTAAGGGSTLQDNHVHDNHRDGIRIMSYVRADVRYVAFGEDAPPVHEAKSQKETKRRAKPGRKRSVSVTLLASDSDSGSDVGRTQSSVARSGTSSVDGSSKDVAELTQLSPQQTPPKHAVLVLLQRNRIEGNGRYGAYVEQLCGIHDVYQNTGTDPRFDQMPTHRLVLPPHLLKNTFANNAGAGVCVRLATHVDTGALVEPPSPSAPEPGTTAEGTKYEAALASGLWYYAPLIEGNSFASSHTGVLVDNGASALLRHNKFRQQDVGVRVDGKLTAVVVGDGNNFGGGAVGVRMQGTTTSKVFRCVFDVHTTAAVLVSNAATPVVAKNTFRGREGGDDGPMSASVSTFTSPARQRDAAVETVTLPARDAVAVAVRDVGTAPVVVGNVLMALRLAMYISDFANPMVVRNKFSRCTCGVHIDRGGEGALFKNLFVDASDTGALVTHPSSRPTFEKCVFEKCVNAGLKLACGAGGRVNNCWLYANGVGVVIDDAGSHSVVSDCVFTSNLRSGVLVRSGSGGQAKLTAPAGGSATQPTVTGCFFEDNCTLDLALREGGSAAVTRNVFMGSAVSADGATGVISSNLFIGSVDRAMVLEPNGRTEFRENVVSNAKTALCAMRDACGTCSGNVAFNCSIGIDAEAGSKSLFTKNLIANNHDCGVKAAGSEIKLNEICDCPVGVVGPDHGTPSFSENIITRCNGEGLIIGGGGSYERNVVSFCRVGMRVVSTVSTPHVAENMVMDCMNEGGVLTCDARCVLLNNDFFDHGSVSLVVEAGSICTIDANRISSPNDRSALELSPEAKGAFKSNVVRNQFSPAYKKMLTQGRHKESKKHAAVVAGRVASADADIGERSSAVRVIVDVLTGVRAELTDEAITPPAALADRCYGDVADEPVLSARSDIEPVPFRRRANSTVEVRESAPVPPARSRAKSLVTRVNDAVTKSRTPSSSRTAQRVKEASKKEAGKLVRAMVHRFTSGRSMGVTQLVRDLGGQIQSATEQSSAVTTVATTTKDPVTAVLRTSSCDAVVVVFPPASEKLTEEELAQLLHINKFLRSKNLATLANKAANAGGGDKPVKRGVACVCVLPKFFLTADGQLFSQPAVASFMRTHGLLVDDGSTTFLQDVIDALQHPTGVREALTAKYAIPDGFVPPAPTKAQNTDAGAEE